MAAMDEYRWMVYVTAWVWIGCTTKIRAEKRDMVLIEKSGDSEIDATDKSENSGCCFKMASTRK
jgi:hypothetical protein